MKVYIIEETGRQHSDRGKDRRVVPSSGIDSVAFALFFAH